MKKLVLGLVSILVLALVGCGSQDPLNKQSDDVKNATVMQGQRKTERGPGADDMILVPSSRSFSFVEQTEGTASFVADVKIDGYKIVGMEVINLGQFPGAQFNVDPKNKSGMLKWTPASHFTGGRISLSQKITIDVVAAKCDDCKPRIVKSFDYDVTVHRSETKPVIVAVEGLSSSYVREGRSRDFIVKVKDVDGVNQKGQKPVLKLLSDSDKYRSPVKNLAPFVNFMETEAIQDRNDPTLWIFKMNLDLTSGFKVTTSEDTFSLGFMVYTQFGLSSDEQWSDVRVRTDISQPQTTVIDDVLELSEGGTLTYQFIAYEKNYVSHVDVAWSDADLKKLPGRRELVCIGSAVTSCTLKWSVPATPPPPAPAPTPGNPNPTPPPPPAPAPRNFTIPLTLTVDSPVNENYSKTERRVLKLRLVKGATP